MHQYLLLFAVALPLNANPWTGIFKQRDHWQPAQDVTANEKNLTIAQGDSPKVFTNAVNPKNSGYLQTNKDFGDCIVEAEFMIPKGSNSGIYLQGRYEIQILDSFGKAKVGPGDMGGIYERWDDKKNPKGFEGHAPKTNAAKAPGEWQKFVIKFRAPRFDSSGELTEKPMFLSVVVNGQEVHRNVTLNGPTRAAQRNGFAAKDKIFIQGDHGPIAFRTFKVTEASFSKP